MRPVRRQFVQSCILRRRLYNYMFASSRALPIPSFIPFATTFTSSLGRHTFTNSAQSLPVMVGMPTPTNHTTGRKLPPPPPIPLPPLPPAPPPLYAIAPMMDVTDRHFRALARLISRRATLYTEMVVDRTLIHNEVQRVLELYVPPGQHAVVAQLGGSDPHLLAAAAAMAARHPYAELNLNCGCPSPKVAGNGLFGAALMKDPELVAACCRAMRLASGLPVTVKCRLGLDDDTSFSSLRNFVSVVAEEGDVKHFIIHARNAILGGLSPAQNRSIPPLRYDFVYRLIEQFPELQFSINGGIKDMVQVRQHLDKGVHGVMVGRAVMDAPWRALRDVDGALFGETHFVSRREVLNGYVEYARREMEVSGASTRALVKPLLNMFVGERNGKMFRRMVDELLREGVEDVGVLIERALAVIPEEVLEECTGDGSARMTNGGRKEDTMEEDKRSGRTDGCGLVMGCGEMSEGRRRAVAMDREGCGAEDG